MLVALGLRASWGLVRATDLRGSLLGISSNASTGRSKPALHSALITLCLHGTCHGLCSSLSVYAFEPPDPGGAGLSPSSCLGTTSPLC